MRVFNVLSLLKSILIKIVGILIELCLTLLCIPISLIEITKEYTVQFCKYTVVESVLIKRLFEFIIRTIIFGYPEAEKQMIIKKEKAIKKRHQTVKDLLTVQNKGEKQ